MRLVLIACFFFAHTSDSSDLCKRYVQDWFSLAQSIDWFDVYACMLTTPVALITCENFIRQKEVTPRSEDPKEIERKITYATASKLMKVYEAKCERQGWGEPDAIQKDIL